MDYSAANYDLWKLIIQMGLIAGTILTAQFLYRVIKPLRKSMLPVAVLAGFLLLLLKYLGVPLEQDLLAKVQALGRELPVNTLDELIDQLGGPECVAEVSSGAPWWPAWWGWLLGPVSCSPLQAVLPRPNPQPPSLSLPLPLCACALSRDGPWCHLRSVLVLCGRVAIKRLRKM